jgi:hypothetical protein
MSEKTNAPSRLTHLREAEQKIYLYNYTIYFLSSPKNEKLLGSSWRQSLQNQLQMKSASPGADNHRQPHPILREFPCSPQYTTMDPRLNHAVRNAALGKYLQLFHATFTEQLIRSIHNQSR